MNKFFLSCDWGTSAFRLRLIDAESLTILAEEREDSGIAATFKAWQQSAQPRETFYAGVINTQIELLAQKLHTPLDSLPVVLSGMASSTIGMVELPYKPLPFKLDGSDLLVETFNRFTVISGACTAHDVMRGEETKITGCARRLPLTRQEMLLILPGTHPKHARVANGEVQDFQTFMTGEFFDLLTTHSILAASVANDGAFYEQWFTAGVKAGHKTNLLHAGFMVRTNQVLKSVPPRENRSYLSGLLIGSELQGLRKDLPVYIVGGKLHTPLYSLACSTLHIPVAGLIDADEALIQGQLAVLSNLPG